MENKNTAALFKNDKKEKDTHPDYKGNGEIGGKQYWLSGWKSKSKSGVSYLSIALTEKQATQEQNIAAANVDEEEIGF